MFSVKDMQLKQWTITDPQGYDTTVALYNLDLGKKLDPSMFRDQLRAQRDHSVALVLRRAAIPRAADPLAAASSVSRVHGYAI